MQRNVILLQDVYSFKINSYADEKLDFYVEMDIILDLKLYYKQSSMNEKMVILIYYLFILKAAAI